MNGGNEANEGNVRSNSSLKMFVTLIFDFGFSVQNIVSPVYLCVRAYANVFLKYVKIETKNDHNKL